MTTQTHWPAALRQDRPADHLSQRYTHVNTEHVIDAMQQAGFVVGSARNAKKRNMDAAFAKHEVDFRLPDAEPIHGAVPRVLFVNSHDGSSGVRVMAGVYRFVCSNGLVIGDTIEEIRLRHSGRAAAELVQRMQSLAKNTAGVFEQIDRWSKIRLTEPQKREFGTLAGQLRWGDAARYPVEELLQVRRAEDKHDDLWTVFNRIQETAVKGGLSGITASGRTTVARPITDISRDHSFNSMLWRLTNEFSEHVTL